MAKKVVFSDLKSGQQLKITLKGKTNIPYTVKKDEVRFVVVGTTENTKEKVLIPAFTKEDLENKAKIISEEQAVDTSKYVLWQSVTREKIFGYNLRTLRFLDFDEIYLLSQEDTLKKFNHDYQTMINSLNFYQSDVQTYDFTSPELNPVKVKIREKLLQNKPEKIVLPIIEDDSLLEQALKWGVVNTEDNISPFQKKIDNFISKMESKIALDSVFNFIIYLQEADFTDDKVDLNEFITSDDLLKNLNDKTGNILQSEDLTKLAAKIIDVVKEKNGNEHLVISLVNKNNPEKVLAKFSVLFKIKKFSNENLLHNLASGHLAALGFRTLNFKKEALQKEEITKILNSKITEIKEDQNFLEETINEEKQNFTANISNEELGLRKQKLFNNITEKIVFVNNIQKISFLQELIVDNVKSFLIAVETFFNLKQIKTALLPALESGVKFNSINNAEIKALLSENFTELVELHKLCPPAIRECFGSSYKLVIFLNNFKKYEINKIKPNLFLLDYTDSDLVKKYNALVATKKNKNNEKEIWKQVKTAINIDDINIDKLIDMYIDDFPHHKFDLSEHFLLKEQFIDNYEVAKIKFEQIIDELVLEEAEEAKETSITEESSKFYVTLPELEKPSTADIYEQLRTNLLQVIIELKVEEQTKTELVSYDEAKSKINEIIKQLQQQYSRTELEVFEQLKREFNEVIDQFHQQTVRAEFTVNSKRNEKIDKVVKILTLQQEEAADFSRKVQTILQISEENVRIKQGKWKTAETLYGVFKNFNEITDNKKITFRVIKNYNNKKFIILYNAGLAESPFYKIGTLKSDNIVCVEAWDGKNDLPTLNALCEMQAVINDYLNSDNPVFKEKVNEIFDALQKGAQVIYFDKTSSLNIANEWQWKANLKRIISKLPDVLKSEIKNGVIKIDFSEESKKRISQVREEVDNIFLDFTISLETDDDLNLTYKTEVGPISFCINRDSNFFAKTHLTTISKEINLIMTDIKMARLKWTMVIKNLTLLLEELTKILHTKQKVLAQISKHNNFKVHSKNMYILEVFYVDIMMLMDEITEIKDKLWNIKMLEKNDDFYNEFVTFFNAYRAANPVSPHDFEKYHDWEEKYSDIKSKLYAATSCEDFYKYQTQTIKNLDEIESKIIKTEKKLSSIINNKKTKFKALSFIKKIWHYLSWTLKSTRRKIAQIKIESEEIFTLTNAKIKRELQNIDTLAEKVIIQEAKIKEPLSNSGASSDNQFAAMVNETLPPHTFAQKLEQLSS